VTVISVTDFSGEMPILGPVRLPNNLAQFTNNCKFVNGDLLAFLRHSNAVATFPILTESIYWYDRRLWITRTHDMDIVPSPIVNDEIKRIYKTEEGIYPEMSFDTQIDAGNWFKLGVPSPEHGPTLTDTYTKKSGSITKILSQTEYDEDPDQTCEEETCATTGTGPLVVFSVEHGLEDDDSVKITMPIGATFLDGRIYNIKKIDDDHFSLSGASPNEGFPYESGGSWEEYRDETEKETRGYVYTFVTDQGEEGPPSPITVIDVYSDSTIDLSDLADDTSGGDHSFFDAALKRIYRSVTAATGTRLHFIGEIPYSSFTFTDDIDPAEIGEPLPSESWDMPPEDMRGIVTMPNGILAGFAGRDICFSVPFMPHAWPIEYRMNVDSDIVAMAVFGQSMVIATKERPYIVTGTDSASMSMEKMEINQSCVSKRGMVDMGYSVIYPSPDGLIEVKQGSVQNITRTLFSREQWQALKPETIRAYANEGRYFFSSDEISYILNPTQPTMTRVPYSFGAGFTDIQEDELYMLVGSSLYIFEGGQGRETYEWRSKKFRLPAPSCMAAAHVLHRDGTCTLTVYADDVEVANIGVSDSDPFRLPGEYLARDIEFKLCGDARIEAVYLSTSIQELRTV